MSTGKVRELIIIFRWIQVVCAVVDEATNFQSSPRQTSTNAQSSHEVWLGQSTIGPGPLSASAPSTRKPKQSFRSKRRRAIMQWTGGWTDGIQPTD